MPVAAVADFRASSSHKVWKLRDRLPRQRQVWNQSLQQQKHPSQVEKGVGDFVSEYRNLTPATRTPKRRCREELVETVQPLLSLRNLSQRKGCSKSSTPQLVDETARVLATM